MSIIEIVNFPIEVIDYLNENDYTNNPNITLSRGLVSLSGEPIKPKYNLIELLSAHLNNTRVAKPINEVLETGFDDDLYFSDIQKGNIESFLDRFYSLFNARNVEKRIEQLNGAYPAIGVWRDVEKYNKGFFGYFIPHKDVPQHLEKIVVMKTYQNNPNR